MKNTYGDLFKPYKVGPMELKNRLVLAPMDYKFFYGNRSDSTVTKRLVDVLRARAKGGAALLITSQVKAEQTFDPFPRSLDFPIIDRDERIKEFAELSDAVHLYGSKIVAELGAGGGRYADIIEEGDVIYSASAVPTQYDDSIMTRPATKEEIAYLVDAYGKAAGRLKAAGFDGICVMASSGYLIAQFLSPAWNHREDEYGGSLENRMRFLVECIKAAKANAGDDFAIMVSLCLDERLDEINMGTLTTGEAVGEGVKEETFSVPGGMKVNDVIELCQKLEEMGLVDGYHTRIGNYYDQEPIIPSAYSTNEEYRRNVIEFKKHVTKPVIFENKLSDPNEMQRILEDGEADLISMGRGWIAEPNWGVKAQRDPESIRPCIRCMMCLDTLWHNRYCQCAVNPQFGHEAEKLTPTAHPKKVVVAGGGPAGVIAALTAQERGFDVVLAERTDKLGGRLPEAGSVDFKPEIGNFGKWLQHEADRTGLNVVYNQEATPEWVLAQNPDVAIVATGAETKQPTIKGGDKTILAEDILLDRTQAKGRVVILGGGLTGSEAAFKLREAGFEDVTLVAARDDIMVDVSVVYRHTAVKKVYDMGVKVKTGWKAVEVTDEGVVSDSGEILPADTVIWAKGERADKKLYDALNEQLDEVYLIGDNRKPRKVFYAVREAYYTVADLD